jgi:hypothetical protein
MIKLNTRARVIIVSILTAIIYAVQATLDFESYFNLDSKLFADLLKGLILGVFLYIGAFWALFFKVRGERLITIMLFPSFGIIALSILLQLILTSFIGGIGQIPLFIVSLLTIAFFTYINLLSVNILNTSYLQNIPLAQAAKAAIFILSLLDGFLIFFLLFTNDINILYRISGAFLTVLLLSYISLWSVDMFRSEKLLTSIALAVLLSFIAGVISIWPISAPYLALTLTLIFYIFMNISLEMREIISEYIWVEYAIIFSLILLLLLLLSEWGINGLLIN